MTTADLLQRPGEPDEVPWEPQDGEEPQRSLFEDLRDLIDDGMAVVSTEIAFQKTRASYAATGIAKIAAFGASAAVVAFVALVALAVGLIFALAPILTPLGAMAVVVGALLLGAALLGLLALSTWKRMIRAITDDGAAGEDKTP